MTTRFTFSALVSPRSPLPRPRRVRAMGMLVAAAVLAGAAPTVSLAQSCFPASLPGSISLSTEDAAQIKKCVDDNKALLAGDDKEGIKRARRALGTVFDDPAAVSVTFRVELARVLTPELAKLVTDQRDLVAANALQLAGELATTDSIALLTRGLDDTQRPAIRYAAAYGYRRMFEQIRDGAGAVQPRDAVRAIQEIAGRIAKESDGHVLEGYVRALEAAILVPTRKVEDLRPKAAEALAKSMGARLQAAEDEQTVLRAAVRAAQALRDAGARVAMPAEEPNLPDAVFKEAAGLGGDLLALVKRQIGAGELPADSRAELSGVADLGYTVYYFSAEALRVQVARDELPGVPLRNNNDTQFVRIVDKIIGPAGVLTKAPFSIAADRFGK